MVCSVSRLRVARFCNRTYVWSSRSAPPNGSSEKLAQVSRAKCYFPARRGLAATLVGLALWRGVSSCTFGYTMVFRCAALLENRVRGVDVRRQQGGIRPIRNFRVQGRHVVLQSLSGPGFRRRPRKHEWSLAGCRTPTNRCQVRAQRRGWPPHSFALSCPGLHTVSSFAPGPGRLHDVGVSEDFAHNVPTDWQNDDLAHYARFLRIAQGNRSNMSD